jgi:hypothetical protein
MAKKVNRPLLDRFTRTCVAAIGRGDLAALTMLADYFDERGHPLAGKLRGAVAEWQRKVSYFQRADFSKRRRWTRWEAVAAWHAWVRTRVCRILNVTFRTKLGVKDRAELYRMNVGVVP